MRSKEDKSVFAKIAFKVFLITTNCCYDDT